MKMDRLLLCTDMDRTVIPNGSHPEHPESRKRFRQLCNSKYVKLVYVTGRHLELVRQAIADYDLPSPEYVITDVGSKIYRRFHTEYHELLPWQDKIAKDWRSYTHHQLQKALHGISELTLQEQSKQNDLKLSYYLPLSLDRETILKQVEQQLALLGVLTTLIFSVDEPEQVALLDILPRNGTKLHAIEFLQKYLEYALTETIFAGDSGNDLVVMGSSILSILVANAEEEVRQQALQSAERNGNRESLYVSGQGEYPLGGNYTAGILEGVAYFAPELMNLVKLS